MAIDIIKFIGVAGSLLAGVVVGIVLNYFLYRIGLPVKPFIYQAF